MPFAIKRAYEEPSPADGFRVLVDRLWPRGRSKAALRLDAWERDLAPSDTLCAWFGRDPARWDGFCERYRRELAAPALFERMLALVELARAHPMVTLVYGGRDELHNQAAVLRETLEGLSKRRGR